METPRVLALLARTKTATNAVKTMPSAPSVMMASVSIPMVCFVPYKNSYQLRLRLHFIFAPHYLRQLFYQINFLISYRSLQQMQTCQLCYLWLKRELVWFLCWQGTWLSNLSFALQFLHRNFVSFNTKSSLTLQFGLVSKKCVACTDPKCNNCDGDPKVCDECMPG